jgi:hypothetical protein
VILTIMLQVAPLAERHQVARVVVRGIVVAVSGCEHHTRGPDLREKVLTSAPRYGFCFPFAF